MLFAPIDSNRFSRSSVPVLPIVGMGGIWKTTLAQLVCNNPAVEKCFDFKIWIDVGESFNVRKLIRDILVVTERKNEYGSPLPQLSILQSRLQESVLGKRCLLVLDNVWETSEDEWSKLREPLSCGIGGSKLVVTTRHHDFAKLIGTYDSYILKPLGESDCWSLFQKLVFHAGGEEETYPVLTGIGKNIVKKCCGLPLATKVLGSLLRYSRDEREWLNVLDSEIWNLRDNSILSALKLTYNHLPPNQKQCFLYCSVFPKGFELSREKLIHQWIAEGLIPFPEYGDGRKIEDTANGYFDDLILMSLFEVVSYSDYGRITEFRVPNLIHDLASYVNRPGHWMESPEEVFFSGSNRRAYVACNKISSILVRPLRFAKLRTLHLTFNGSDLTDNLSSLFKNFKHLRVLSLNNCGITTLHKSVGRLLYLRYLDLSNNLMSMLPGTLCHLLNLQSLNLSGCHALKELPSELSDLVNLRHLNIEECISLSQIPKNIAKIGELQTLSIFTVGPDVCRSLEQLMRLRYLRGELKIKHLENARGVYLGGFCLKHKLIHTLSLSWGDDSEQKARHNTSRQNVQGDQWPHETLIEYLVPASVRVFQIHGFMGAQFPKWMNSLPNLSKLVLVNCTKCKTPPTLGQLPFLKLLDMRGMDEVLNIGQEFYTTVEKRSVPFSCLNKLILNDFPTLRSWENAESLQAFPSLHELFIIKCPNLTNMPRFPSLLHLELQECHDLLLRSASKTNSLSTLVIDVCKTASFIPKPLLSKNSLLTSLKISSCPEIKSLPASMGSVTALKSLSIRFCQSLKTLPREMLSLTNLETFEIAECPDLTLDDECFQGLVSLRSLSIENCSKLDTLPQALQKLVALEHFTVMYCPNLAYLPDVMQEFQALRSLNIIHCESLKFLPSGLQHASLLCSLEIWWCPEIQLPSWIEKLLSLRSLAISGCDNIKVLPDGLAHLKDLQHISITDCPDLERRCKEGTDEDWQKISHIKFKYIGPSASQQGDAASSSSTRR